MSCPTTTICTNLVKDLSGGVAAAGAGAESFAVAVVVAVAAVAVR